MSRITVIDNQYVTLYYHTDLKIVHHIYHPGVGGDYLKEELNRGVELLREHGACKWLSNNSAIEGVTDEETAWINTHWLPEAIAAGWKYWALVVPESVMGRMNMVTFVDEFSNMGVKVRVFTDPEAAMDWLIKVG